MAKPLKKKTILPLTSVRYVAEQHEEEKLFSGIIDKLNLLGDDGKGLFLVDKDLGELANNVNTDTAQ